MLQNQIIYPQVYLLLQNNTEEKEEILYNNNPCPWLKPKIGPRPPIYCNPRYVQYYPIA
ncbi:hypothetical protein ACVLD2_000228 [Paenibacillus sp. PvR052]|nr:hypothetical protein [Paenibacillus sp. PvP091]MBP1168763.1 hypothetical protein [Paenibacillus sp. PvR098]MBP2439791.1 hypothetical protein [Paenibacillus sp. PvP052]